MPCSAGSFGADWKLSTFELYGLGAAASRNVSCTVSLQGDFAQTLGLCVPHALQADMQPHLEVLCAMKAPRFDQRVVRLSARIAREDSLLIAQGRECHDCAHAGNKSSQLVVWRMCSIQYRSMRSP